MDEVKVVRRSVSFRAEDEQTVLQFGMAMGLDFSSALRFIIRDWKRMKGQRGGGEGVTVEVRTPPSVGPQGGDGE